MTCKISRNLNPRMSRKCTPGRTYQCGKGCRACGKACKAVGFEHTPGQGPPPASCTAVRTTASRGGGNKKNCKKGRTYPCGKGCRACDKACKAVGFEYTPGQGPPPANCLGFVNNTQGGGRGGRAGPTLKADSKLMKAAVDARKRWQAVPPYIPKDPSKPMSANNMRLNPRSVQLENEARMALARAFEGNLTYTHRDRPTASNPFDGVDVEVVGSATHGVI